MIRTAKAHWEGDGLLGQGNLTSKSGALTAQPYSYKLRFENADGKSGTNPEELLAASHAACFTMAVAFGLAGAGFAADSLDTEAFVTLSQVDGNFAITLIELKLVAKIEDISPGQFEDIVDAAKANCPISKALSAVPITLDAILQ